VRSIEPPDSHYLSAASGWLDLGNPTEAAIELDQLSTPARSHPATLELLWRLCAGGHRWADALDVARLLIRVASEEPTGWIHQSYALHELGRTTEALDLLQPQADRFPTVTTISYNLACYACQLGQLDEARRWLARAAVGRDRPSIRALALGDEDLKPIWREIAEWPSD